MTNPLIGNRISLISKRNIRYEGTLYSINETDATVTLQNVRSFGTEDREQQSGESGRAVPAQPDTVHPYLVFRGCDIKDLHVHETPLAPNAAGGATYSAPSAAADASAASTNTKSGNSGATGTDAPAPATEEKPQRQQNETTETASRDQSSRKKETVTTPRNDTLSSTTSSNRPKSGATTTAPSSKPRTNRSNSGSSSRSNNSSRRNNQVGTGASLLHKKERGYDGSQVPTGKDFDFESNNAKFDDEEDENADDGALRTPTYAKDDFFDSISCDALDKEQGIDNRLRGKEERSKNTETFGAVALNTNNNYYRRNRRGGGRGRGRGRGRNGGRGGGGRYRSRRNRNNNNNNNNNAAAPPMATASS